jgi:hypothetical protein
MIQDYTVLLLDHDAAACQRLAIRLKPMGIQVHQAQTLNSRGFSVQIPDLIVMEWGTTTIRRGFLRRVEALDRQISFSRRPLEEISHSTACGSSWALKSRAYSSWNG